MIDKNKALNIIKKAAKMYEKNLCNKNILFVLENKDKTLTCFETLFLPSHFKHLTGSTEKIKNNEVSATTFYFDCLKEKISPNNLFFDNPRAKDKLEVLPALMQIDKIAKMVGVYDDNFGILLQTTKVAGSINACLGFKQTEKYFIPNSSLKEDIRKITIERSKVIGVFKKNKQESLYNELIYKKEGIDINTLTGSDLIDTTTLYSINQQLTYDIINNLNVKQSLNQEEDEEER